MLTGIIVTVIILAVFLLSVLTGWGSRAATELRVFLSWIWLIRISTLGLAALLMFPVLARGAVRGLLLGTFDLHGNFPSGLIGAVCVGFLLIFAIWTVYVTGGLTISYGKRRTEFVDDAPAYFVPLFRVLLVAALLLNVWTAIAATDPIDQGAVSGALLLGLIIGGALTWQIEEWHALTSNFSMRKHQFWSHRPRDRNAKPQPRWALALMHWSNNLGLRPIRIQELRGYVGSRGGRSYLLPGHLLAALATVIFVLVGLVIYFAIRSQSQLTALVYLLILLITTVWALAGSTFFFDAHRIPVLLPLVAWLVAASFFSSSDHYYRIWPAPPSPSPPTAKAETPSAKETGPMRPAEVLERASTKGRRIVLVAAAGGGIQATAWTAKVLAELQRLSTQTGSEADSFASSVQMLSGVSGGSGGIMFFVAGYGGQGFPAPFPSGKENGPGQTPASAVATPVRDRNNDAMVESILKASRDTSLGQSTWGIAFPDLARAFVPFYMGDPFKDRGDAMEQAWAFNAQPISELTHQPLFGQSLEQWRKDTREGIRPAVIFNSTVVETGERMSFSTAPPRRGYEGRREFSVPAKGAVFPESFVYAGADLRITTAVRMSSTFPYVSPLGRPGVAASAEGTRLMSAEDPKVAAMIAGDTGHLHLADGGYYENSGLVDLAQWLDDGLTELAGRATTEKTQMPLTEVLVIQTIGFPEDERPSEPGAPLPPVEQQAGQRGSLFQIFGPLKTIAAVRGAGHSAFSRDNFVLVQHRWALDQHPVTIRHVRFIIPKTAPLKPEHWWMPGWAEAKPDQPPLSWHLRGAEQKEIDRGWDQLWATWKADQAQPQKEIDWKSPRVQPIQKVLQFLKKPSETPATPVPAP